VRVLVISQVALSAALPFALVLLTVLISRRQLMGSLVNRPAATAAAAFTTAAIMRLSRWSLGVVSPSPMRDAPGFVLKTSR